MLLRKQLDKLALNQQQEQFKRTDSEEIRSTSSKQLSEK